MSYKNQGFGAAQAEQESVGGQNPGVASRAQGNAKVLQSFYKTSLM